MLYHSLFKSPWQRESVQYAAEWFHNLSNDGKNPFFYISHSPWNIYQNIIKFLDISKFPIGPVLLRDYGFYAFGKPEEYTNHKKIYIQKILDMHTHLPFILIGDAAEKDAAIYFDFLEKFPERVERIYIRSSHKMSQDLSKFTHHPKFTIIENFKDAL
jgi:phosphatidate phosphatase APP1